MGRNEHRRGLPRGRHRRVTHQTNKEGRRGGFRHAVARQEADPELHAVGGQVENALIFAFPPHGDRRTMQAAMDAMMVVTSDLEGDPGLVLLQRKSCGPSRIVALLSFDGAVRRAGQQLNRAHLGPDQALDVTAVVFAARWPICAPPPCGH